MRVSGRVCAGVYGDALKEMEASPGPDCMGHTPHHGLHLHLQWPYRCTLGPGNPPLPHTGSDQVNVFAACDSVILSGYANLPK